MSNAMVSFIITSYNYARYIEECISSCLKQDPSDLTFEVILVDDGSSDNTLEIVDKFSKAHNNFFAYKITNRGIEGAANFGFSKARGEYIIRVDADDRLHRNYLSVISAYLDPDIDFYYSNYTTIDASGNDIEVSSLPPFDPREIRMRGDFLAGGTMYCKRVFANGAMYESEWINSGLENYELILTLLHNGRKGKLISSNLFDYRRHALNMSALNTQKIIKNGQRLFDKYGLGIYTSNSYHPYKLEV